MEGGSREQQIKFYTDLWHALLGRKVVSDVDGCYLDQTSDFPRICRIPLSASGKPLYNHHNLMRGGGAIGRLIFFGLWLIRI